MQLYEFPYFAPDLINLEASGDISGLQEIQPVQLQTHGEGWLLQQGSEIIPVSCNKQDKPLLTSLVLRDQTQWLLAQAQTNNNRLQLQYLTPAEVKQIDLQLGVDGLISYDLFTKNEIRENNIEQACQWLHEHFVVTSGSFQKSAVEQNWLTISRFSNQATSNGFQLLGKGWRADVEQQKDGKHLIRRITRHLRQDSAFSLLIGEFSFADGSATAAINSAVYQAQLQAALRDNGSYLELWNLYNDKEWENELKRAETLKALRFTHAEPFEDGRINRWSIWPKSIETYKEFCARWNDLDLDWNQQVDLSHQPPDWGEELTEDTSDDNKIKNTQQNPRGEIRFEEDRVVFTSASNRRDTVPRFPAQKTESGSSGTSQQAKGGWLYLSMAGQRTVAKRRLSARQSIDTGRRMPQLKALLEGISVPSERRRPIKGLTPYVKAVNQPTSNYSLWKQHSTHQILPSSLVHQAQVKPRSSLLCNVVWPNYLKTKRLQDRYLSAVSSMMRWITPWTAARFSTYQVFAWAVKKPIKTKKVTSAGGLKNKRTT